MAEINLVLVKPETDAQLMAFYSEAVRLKEFAESRVITCNDDLKPANDDLVIIRKIKKGMEAKRKDYLSPFQNHVKEVNEAYKTLMEPIEQADKITTDKMLAFDAEQKRKRREVEAIEAEKLALARREAELKGGEITVDLTPIEKPELAPDRIRTEMGSSGHMTIRKYRVINFTELPDQYKIENSALLNKVVKAGIPSIPGVEIYTEETLRVMVR